MIEKTGTKPSADGTMRALRVEAVGGPLTLGEAPIPEPGAGEIRIRVVAAGVNFADSLMVAGKYQERPEPPFTPGLEAVGIVDAIGPDARLGGRAPQIGETIAAMCQGGFAEYALVDARAAARVPPGLDPVLAAAAPVAYGTGLVALDDRAGLQAGERLLVTGAAGGVGLTAVELGKLLGAEVIGAARGAEKCAAVKAKGADHVIDTDSADVRDALKALGGVDVAYETVGGTSWDAAFRAARPGARLLPIGFAGGEVPQIPANILLVKNLTVIGFYWGGWMKRDASAFGVALERIFGWLAEGKLAPEVVATPLSQGAEALERIRARKVLGKIVLTP